MKFFLILCFVAWMGASPRAHAEDDAAWVSTDHRFQVVIQMRHGVSGMPEIGYALIAKDKAGALAFMPATYQLDPEASEKVKAEERDLVESAEVYWSPDGKYVVVDECAMHGSGQVFIVAIATGKRVEVSQFERDMAWATGVEWVRSRIRVSFEVPWKEGRLQLEIGGTPKAPGGAMNTSFRLEADLSGFPDLAFGHAVRRE